MQSPPAILSLKVGDDFVLEIDFENIGTRFVDLSTFPFLGPKAKRLGGDLAALCNFKLVDGIVEWDGMALLAPEDLFKNATIKRLKIGASIFASKLREGIATWKDFSDAVVEWHDSPTNDEVWEYLGISQADYEDFAKHGTDNLDLLVKKYKTPAAFQNERKLDDARSYLE